MKNKIYNTMERIKINLLKLKYKSKCKKLNISDEMLEGLLVRINMEEVKDILYIIGSSIDLNNFRNNIVNYCKKRNNIYISTLFLFGNITGNYSRFTTTLLYNKDYNYDNFNSGSYKSTLKILRDNFYEYLLNNNELKNKFLIDKEDVYDYNLDLDKDLCLKIFDATIEGKKINENIKYAACYAIVREYINNIIGIYGKDIIENNFNFILYDINNKVELSLEERRKKYLERNKLNEEQKYKIDNINKLINKLKTINNEKAKELLERLNNIDNKEENIFEIEDIYAEYEILLREDILSRLYVPTKEYTLVEDYRDLEPQLIHMLFRDSEKFRANIEDRIIKDIISKRKDEDTSLKLSKEEKKEYQKRMGLANAMLDPIKVNYSFDGREFVYSDKNGFDIYHSDTSNQISGTLYSSEYFISNGYPWYIGIGFNKEETKPEAIAISSSYYLTTNKGLNNIEYDNSNEFELISSTYSELVKNDGKSEIVLFRRNIDYDTKGSYIFVTIDSTNKIKSEEIIKKAKEMSERNNIKLVVYDLYKIKNSYYEALLPSKVNIK